MDETRDLARHFRPRTFSEVAGQSTTIATLRSMVRRSEVPGSLLFFGPPGVGKTSCARILSAALNCKQSSRVDDACGRCSSCNSFLDGSSIGLFEINAPSYGVEEVRKLVDNLQFHHSFDWRILIVDEAHSLSPAAFDALLKELEEPPIRTSWVLATTKSSALPPTILSRAMPFQFELVSEKETVARLEFITTTLGMPLEHEILVLIARRSRGRVREAVRLLDQARHAGARNMAELSQLFGHTRWREDLLEAALARDWRGLSILRERQEKGDGPKEIINDLSNILGDILAIQGEGEPTAESTQEVDPVRDLAGRTDRDSAVLALRDLTLLRQSVKPGEGSGLAPAIFEALAGRLHLAGGGAEGSEGSPDPIERRETSRDMPARPGERRCPNPRPVGARPVVTKTGDVLVEKPCDRTDCYVCAPRIAEETEIALVVGSRPNFAASITMEVDTYLVIRKRVNRILSTFRHPAAWYVDQAQDESTLEIKMVLRVEGPDADSRKLEASLGDAAKRYGGRTVSVRPLSAPDEVSKTFLLSLRSAPLLDHKEAERLVWDHNDRNGNELVHVTKAFSLDRQGRSTTKGAARRSARPKPM